MFVDEAPARQCLIRMIRKMTVNLALRDDLLQEALIHLWLTEIARTGQTRSWYLQSCKYHLMHYLSAGRSVDSSKRRAGQMQFAEDSEEADWIVNDDSGASVFGWVSARDIISLLNPHLQSQERAVLECFADGLRVREIGRKLKISHTMVIRHRRKIASLLQRLESPRARHTAKSVKPNRFARELTLLNPDTFLHSRLPTDNLVAQRLSSA
jgi:DNA-directed RNA polymerase specialized sigma24 family protein